MSLYFAVVQWNDKAGIGTYIQAYWTQSEAEKHLEEMRKLFPTTTFTIERVRQYDTIGFLVRGNG